MTRSLFSTSFVLAALGLTLAACGDGSSGSGGAGGTSSTGGGTTSGTAGTTGSTGGTTGTGGTTTGTGGGGMGGVGGTTTSTGGGGMAGSGGGGMAGSGGMMTTSSTSTGMTTTTTITPIEDEDGDGWKISDGDCCDSKFAGCSDRPELVNPGALEYPGNGVDDDCNAATPDDQPYPTCSTAMAANMDIANFPNAVISSTKLVKAMDLCVFTQEAPALKEKTWGVILSKLTLADGSEAVAPKNIQLGVLPDFGPNVKPQYGETMAAISTGTARREGDPGYTHPQNGPAMNQVGNFNAGTSCPAPPDYVLANGGALPSPCGNCMGNNCTVAYDSVALRVRLRPPTNAKSFSYRFNFFSAEYPEFLCEDFNDFFVALLYGNNLAPEIPVDKNIAFDAMLNPVSVNNSFFDVCFPAVGAPPGSCSGGTLQLVGNGMGGWMGSITDGGGTGWLQNDVPLALKQNPNNPNDPKDLIPTADPIELQLTIWDSGDHNVDSLVLLDRFRWNLDPASLLVHQ